MGWEYFLVTVKCENISVISVQSSLQCPVSSGGPQTRYCSQGVPSEERKKEKEFKDWGIWPGGLLLSKSRGKDCQSTKYP